MNLRNLIKEMEEFSDCEILAEENHTFTEVTDLWRSAISVLKVMKELQKLNKRAQSVAGGTEELHSSRSGS